MKIKAIIFDLDGTAVDSPQQKLPTERLTVAVKNLQAAQYYMCAATGRSWSFAKDVIQGLALQDLCIISGGTQICNPQTGEIIWQKDIPLEALKKVIEIFKTNDDQKIIYNDYTEVDYFHGGVFPHEFNLNQKVNWLSQSFVPDALALQLQEKLNSVEGITCMMVVAQKPGCRDLHIVNAEATKEHAIMELLQKLKVEKEDAIGIGDGHNDLDLFKAVGTKVAMGNGVKDLQAAADTVIGNVKDDGLAEYFEKLATAAHE